MADHLLDFNRRMNLVFGTCVKIQNTTRGLGQTTFEMELIARNGVVQAAKITDGRGRPLLALAEIMADLPDQIRPAFENLDSLCGKLADLIALCSNRVRLYYQLVTSLLESRRIHPSEHDEAHRTASTTSKDRDSRTTYLHSEDLDRLIAAMPFASMKSSEISNIHTVAELSSQNLEQIAGHLRESVKVLLRVEDQVTEVRTIGHTTRYLAQFVDIEAARLADRGADFVNLAHTINAVVDHLERTLGELQHTLDDGSQLVHSLSEEVRVS